MAILSLFARGLSAPQPQEEQEPAITAATLRDAAWANAHAVAKSEGRTTDFTDYFIAAAEMAPRAEALGITWTHKEIADFSGAKINGVVARLEDFDPFNEQADPAIRQSVIDRTTAALSRGGQGTGDDANKAAQRNLYDLDGNGHIEVNEVSDFYAKVREKLNFTAAELTNVTFQPATTLQIVQNASGAQYGNVVFDGLDTELNMGSGKPLNADNPKGDRFYNVSLNNVKAELRDDAGNVLEEGGGLHLNRNSTIDRLQLNGSGATISLAGPGDGMGNRGAQINNFKADGTDILTLELEPGSRLTQVNFNGCKIDPQSVLKGEWHGGEMNNVDFSGVKLQGTLTELNIHAPELEGASFRGATFRHTQFSGISDFAEFREAMQGAQFHGVLVNGHAMNALGDLDKIEAIEKVAQAARAAISNYGSPQPSMALESAAPSKALETGEGLAANPVFPGLKLAGISGGETVGDTGNTSQSVARTAENAAQREASFAEARVAALMEGYVRS